MLKRGFTTSAQACSTASTSKASTSTARPLLRRTKDPLLASSQATHYTLPSGAKFIVRPPPSVLPPSHSTAAIEGSLVEDANPELSLPISRQMRSPVDAKRLSADEIASMQALRRSDPATWTRSALATKFGVTTQVVGRMGWGAGSEARQAEKQLKDKLEQAKESKEARWGWKKAVAREERRRRRALW